MPTVMATDTMVQTNPIVPSLNSIPAVAPVMANSVPAVPPAPTSPGGSLIVTVRMIMQGKEVGSIIGKKGDNIKKFREQSGAKINISDGSCPERIVTVIGSVDSIQKAFTMICKKFEEDLQNTPTVPKPPITLRLVVPATQCGSLIGKGGSKIKEVRESTGASIQVASEMLPHSTERAVTVSGTADSVTQCIKYVCKIMLASPPKGAVVPYRPKPAMPPVIFAGGQAYAMQPGQMPMPSPEISKLHQIQLGQTAIPMMPAMSQAVMPGMAGPLSFQRPLAAPITNGTQTHEMTIPNDLIGCIIGRGGQKINEIRQLSGATIKIANVEEGSADRKVTITGTPETIGIAQYLINTSMELHKSLNLDPNITPSVASYTPAAIHHPPLIPQHHHLPQMPPQALTAYSFGQLMKPVQVPYVGLTAAAAAASPAIPTSAYFDPSNAAAAAAVVAGQNVYSPKMRVGVLANHTSNNGVGIPVSTVTMKKSANAVVAPSSGFPSRFSPY